MHYLCTRLLTIVSRGRVLKKSAQRARLAQRARCAHCACRVPTRQPPRLHNDKSDKEITTMKGMKTGGRKKGTPNRENPLKGFIRAHSLGYFEPKSVRFNGRPAIMSGFELDMAMLAPDDRVNAELRLLEFHTPKMKAVDVDMSARVSVRTIEDKLSALCAGDTGDGDEDGDEDDD